MPFRYRLQKILDFRIRKKEEQLLEARKAQSLVLKIEGLIDRNNKEIAATRTNMRQADFTMYEAYDNFLKHLYLKGENLEIDRQNALEALEVEKDKLRKLEQAVKVLEKHKERWREIYLEEEKAEELKRLSEVAVQRHFAKTRDAKEDEAQTAAEADRDGVFRRQNTVKREDQEILEQLKQIEGQDFYEC